jgi:ATP-dependent RNA helicase CshB
MMKRIRNDEFRYIVASDIAARGIDIEGVTHVINYNLPYEEDFYFHRAGRTGRNNADGICFTLYDKEEVKYVLRFINKGVKFINREYKNGKWVDLKPLVKQMTPKKKDSEVQKKITKTININKNQKVKPGYKKKLNKEIEKIKQKHRREVIKKDIERQKKARYIAQSKAMKGE